MTPLQFFLPPVIFLTLLAYSQTITTTDDTSGLTLVEVVTIDPALGVPTTLVVSTLGAQGTTGTTTRTTTTPATPTTTIPDIQGPVGQPAPTTATPGGPTPFTYTTIVGGETMVVTDIFTPTNPATVHVIPSGTGTIWALSSWMDQYGPTNPAQAANTASRLTSMPLEENTLAIVFIVESSLPVYHQWGIILKEYVASMFSRLTEAHAGFKIKIGFITYGPGDLPQSPLFCKRFFVDLPVALKEMREHPGKLGVGQANAGGEKGMAALEALIAALEVLLYDSLGDYYQAYENSGKRMSSNYVIHIAATSPDSSQHPLWNDHPLLDETTWDTIPQEFQKRNINYNAILLCDRLHQFISFHTAMQATRLDIKPWFPWSPKSFWCCHSLAPIIYFGSILIYQATLSKRPGDNVIAERTPDSKRPRLNQPKVESPPKRDSSPVQPPSSNQNLTVSRPPVQAGTPQYNFMMHVIAKIRAMEDQVRNLEVRIRDARLSGNIALADELSTERSNQREILNNFHRRFREHATSSSIGGSGSLSNKNGSPPTQPPVVHEVQDPGTTPLSSIQEKQNRNGSSIDYDYSQTNPHPIAQQAPGNVNPISLPPQTLNTNAGHVSLMPNPGSVSRSQSSPITMQMQKLIEQDQRNRLMQSGEGQLPQLPITQSGQPQQPAIFQGRPNASGTKFNLPAVWHGQLIWSGMGPLGKKQCRSSVSAHSQHVTECRADTWPSSLTLVPTSEHLVSMQELKEWISRFKPLVCQFQPKEETSVEPSNEQYYKSLIQVLVTKRVYAVAAWTLPSGIQKNNVLVFPLNEQVLLGAFFPITGIPEMPQTQPTNIRPPSSQRTTQILAQLQRLPPGQREAILAQLLQRQMIQRPSGAVRATAPGVTQVQSSQPSQDLGQSQPLMSQNIAGLTTHEQFSVPVGGLNLGLSQASTKASGMTFQPQKDTRNMVGTSQNYEMLQSSQSRSDNRMG
ncbi:hypothetical protein AMATHDRAFT_45813 [Amanita thiersii Skay4041]|uniref:Mediator of RNA polymerase II transcription subunit 25 n=1 Tax=Amanita thiersii Skay4041 TaxID=703135 RepID=A0A2A9NQF4_9AGAR|nr:hypothetical protein AMATHDRAFT_45813 [Amanita thiersii Skay4041]